MRGHLLALRGRCGCGLSLGRGFLLLFLLLVTAGGVFLAFIFLCLGGAPGRCGLGVSCGSRFGGSLLRCGLSLLLRLDAISDETKRVINLLTFSFSFLSFSF
jgi:hypothetical protein